MALKIKVKPHPSWWFKWLNHFETNVLGGPHARYPDKETYNKLLLEHYGVVRTNDENGNALYFTFKNEQYYSMFLLKVL